MQVAEQPEAGHVGRRVRRERAQDVGGVAVQRPHRSDGACELGLAQATPLDALEHEPGSERLRQEDGVAGTGAVLVPDPGRVDGADDGEPVLGLLVADRVPAREQPAGRAHLLVRRREDGSEHLRRQLLREGDDREREQRGSAHGEDVVERVRRCDRPVVGRVVDERREEVEREDQRALVVQAVDRRVVRRREPDQQILRLDRHEPLQELLEPRGGVLGGAASGRGEVGQPDARSHRPNRSCGSE